MIPIALLFGFFENIPNVVAYFSLLLEIAFDFLKGQV